MCCGWRRRNWSNCRICPTTTGVGRYGIWCGRPAWPIFPLIALPVDVVQMNLPPGSWQEEGNHKGRWHFNFVVSGTGVFKIDGQEYPVEKGSVIIIPAETPHAGRTTGNEPLVMLAVHVSSARSADDRAQGTQAWVRNP